MALTVNSNITSLNVQKNLNKAAGNLGESMQRLSSGLKINSAKDDAAGLQISNRLTNQISGLNTAVKNANDGISIAQTAEGAMQESTNLLQRMRELSLQSANGSNSDADRKALQEEFTALSGELTRIAKTTSFGGKNLLDGTFGSTSFQIGANANQTVSFSMSSISSTDLKGTYSNATTLGGVQKGMAASVTGSGIGAPTATGSSATVTATGNVFPATVGADTTITLNGNKIDLVAADTLTTTVTKLNAVADKTGVTASEENGKLTLTSKQSFEISGAKALGFEGEKAGEYVAVTGRANVVASDTFGKNGSIVTGTSDVLNLGAEGYTATDITLQAGDDLDAIVTRINDKSSTTGVSASNVDGKLQLEAKGEITIGTSTAEGVLGLTEGSYAPNVLGEAKLTGTGTAATMTALSGNSSINLNGTDIAVLKGDTLQDVADRIKAADIGIDAKLDGGALVMTSTSKISVAGEAAALTALGLEKGTTQVATGNAEKAFTYAAGNGELSINDQKLSLSSGDSIDTVISKINELGAGVTAVKEGGNIKLSSESGIMISGEKASDLAILGITDTGGVVKAKAANVVGAQTDGILSGNASISLNGESFDFSKGAKVEDIATKLNQSADATGVTASVKQGRLELTSVDGKSIKLEDASAGSLSKLGLTAGTTDAKLTESTSLSLNGTEVRFGKGDNLDAIVTAINTASTGVSASKTDGKLSLTSDKDFTVGDGAKGTGLEALGLTAGTSTAVTQESSVASLSIETAEGSQMAIQVLDGAMQQIDSERAKLGAVQNRFDSTVSNLQNIAENASAARSQIQDVDFASETAEMAKQQTLQQASTSILAQANQLPSSVLSLLG